ncbi:MAG: dienelactone hydrolase family protein [Prevotella sp.]|nr:dienelactone hydrolase family protein [Prevotella sp.]
MKSRIIRLISLSFLILHVTFFASTAAAQGTDLLSAKRGVIPGGYNFWVYTPEDYYYTQEATPLVLFLHGSSLCGHDLNRALRYGTVAAIKMGLQVPALVITPQNPGGSWNPKKLCDVLDWVGENYAYDHNRVYVLGMSLGGYGTLDFVGTYPERVAAAMALCGGTTLKDLSRMGEAPLWIIHGTADRAVSIRQSQVVVNRMKQDGNTERLRFDWLPGASHGALARYFYTSKTYDWLFSHSLADPDRPVNRLIDINQTDLQQAYRYIERRQDQLETE